MTQTTENAIEVVNIVKRYGSPSHGVLALDDVSLDVAHNEFFTLLGPSGCGKTTLLRLIAGFEAITDGHINLYGQNIHDLPANRRPVNTVFQQYGLFPHMTVAANVAFGLRMLGKDGGEIDSRTREMLDLVQLGEYRDRKPDQLSGGQQQRVALARALAPAPKVLLLDEPLSALDLKLRQAMRVELKQIQQETGITFIFVTHDQEEALTMSDRIAVMSAGKLQQVGSAREIYEAPRNRFVADFIGETNLLDATLENILGDEVRCRLTGGAMLTCHGNGAERVGSPVHLSIRPERMSLTTDPQSGLLRGTVRHFVYLGTDLQCIVETPRGEQVTVRARHASSAMAGLEVGQAVGINIDPGAARLLVD